VATAALDERSAWIVLAGVDGVGEHTFGRLVARHRGAARVLELAARGRLPSDLGSDARPLPAAVRAAIEEAARDPAAFLARLDELELWTLTPLDAGYPDRFSVLDPPPPAIHGWGDPETVRAARSAAIVGTRRPSAAGRALAGRIATALADRGVVVVSGLAVGIDGSAHAATVERGGRTVGVIGSGHARPGPGAHRALVKALLAAGGAVISELAPDTVPSRGTFPRRNRLISALGEATVVVEAPARSGALITAAHALEQGRPLFVAPGRPGERLTAGCLRLLRETPARIVAGVDELIADLGLLDAVAAPGAGEQAAPIGRAAALELLGSTERAIADRLCQAPCGPDGLVAATGLAPGSVAAALTLLQLRGWVVPSGAVYLPSGPLLAG
jgi:DNA processing protein